MSRFHDAMMRKQQAEAEQESGRKSASENDGRVSILPIPNSPPVLHQFSSDEDVTNAPEERATEAREELKDPGAASAEIGPTADGRGASQVSRNDTDPAYERIIQRMLAHRRAKRENVYLVASAVAGEGASTVARGLAKAICLDQSERVVLVDANLRTPSQHDAFGFPRSEGLVEVLTGRSSLSDSVSTDPVTGLAVITSGSLSDSPPHLLSQSAFQSVVAALQAEFDWVVLDGPPVTTYPDAASIANVAGAALLVLRAERTRWEVADEARRVLDSSGVEIVGAVLNRRKYHIPSIIYRRL